MSFRRTLLLVLLGNAGVIVLLGSLGLVVGSRAYRSMRHTSDVWMPRAMAISRLREHGGMLLEQWRQFLWEKYTASAMAEVNPATSVELTREAYRKLIEVRESRSRLAVWHRVFLGMNPSTTEELQVCSVVDSLLRLSRALEAKAWNRLGFQAVTVAREEVEAFGLNFRNIMDQASALEQQRVVQEREESEQGVRRGLLLFTLAILLGFLGATAHGIYLANRMGRPIVTLAKAASAVAQGRFDVRVEPGVRGGEIGVLTSSFNQMVERLQEMTLELEASNEALREELEERRKAEMELERERNLLQAVIDHIPDGVYFKGSQGCRLLANRQFFSLFGSGEGEEVGRVSQELEVLIEEIDGEVRQHLSPRLEQERELEDSSGRTLTFRISVVPVRDSEGQLSGTVGIVRDVTAAKEAEKQIRENEQRYRAVFETAPVGMFVADTAGKVVAVNDALLDIMGSPSREHTMSLNVLEHPHLRRYGFSEPVEQCIRTGRRVQKELTYRSVWGKEVEIALYLSPILDERGEVRFVQGIVDDMTERKRLERQFLQAQKMEAIGRLAGGIAHDFNNIMTGILGYAQFLLMECPPEDPRHGDLVEIEKLARRAASLTQQLLAFSRQQMLQVRPLNLNSLLLDMEKMLRRLIGEDILLETKLSEDLPLVEADPVQMQQVVMNLVLNSRDAMPGGGKLIIETTTAEVDAEFAGRHVGLRPGLYVALVVSDTGVGMDAATQARAFEPFFTTKKVGQGTGLGLSTVKGIVEQCGGAVWLYSELGKGTTVKVYLPARSEGEGGGAATGERGEYATQGSETILFVEDEEGIRDMMHRALTNLGYRVLVASDAEEALRICERHTGPIDLLLTDVVMPGMNGPALAGEIRKRYPNIRVLFTSGYAHEVLPRSAVAGGDVQLVPKPYTPAEMARKIREVLESQTKVS